MRMDEVGEKIDEGIVEKGEKEIIFKWWRIKLE